MMEPYHPLDHLDRSRSYPESCSATDAWVTMSGRRAGSQTQYVPIVMAILLLLVLQAVATSDLNAVASQRSQAETMAGDSLLSQAASSLENGRGPAASQALSCSPSDGGASYSCGPSADGPRTPATTASANWTQILPSTPPGNRGYAAMTYDPADGYVVLFGGYDGKYLDDTWTFVGGEWTELTETTAPSARLGASMAYDAKDGYVILFGGNDGSYLQDTWKFSGGSWTEFKSLTSANSPGARYDAMMAYDSSDNYVVLFGGYGCSTGSSCTTVFLQDTWEFVGGTWTELSPTNYPPTREAGSMAYDTADGYLMLFGGFGCTSGGSCGTNAVAFQDTWEFKAGDWTQLSPSTPPGTRELAAMTYDAADGYVVMFGGFGCNTGTCDPYVAQQDTWKFEGGQWTELYPASSPSALYHASIAFDTADNYTVLFGGENAGSTFVDDTWAYEVFSVSESPTNATMLPLSTGKFTAAATCSSTCPVGLSYHWSLANPSLGSLNTTAGPQVTFTAGAGNGESLLYANASLDGVNATSSSVVVVSSLVSAAVTPAMVSISPHGTQTFNDTLNCTSICPAGASYAWKVTNGAMGSISPSSGPAVTFTANSNLGTVGLFVNTTLGTITRESEANITIDSLVSVSVTPPSVTISSGSDQHFTASPACGAACPSGTTYVWSVTNASRGSINSTTGARVTFTAGSGSGSAGLFVNATLNGVIKEGSAVITVVPLLSVAVSPSSSSLSPGGSEKLNATPTCVSSCPSGIAYSWSLDPHSMGTLNATSGISVTLSSGDVAGNLEVIVNATLNGLTKEGIATVTIVTLDSVLISPGNTSLSPDGGQNFSATPTCSAGCPSGISYSWALTSTSLGNLNKTSGSQVSFLADETAGTVALFVNASLNGIMVESSAVAITVVPLISVSLSPANVSLTLLGSHSFIAMPTCLAACPSGIVYTWGLNVSSAGSFNSTTGSPVTFTASNTPGTFGIFVSAALDGITKTSSLANVTVVPLTSVSLTPSSAILTPGSVQSFTAAAKCLGTCPVGVTYSWALSTTDLGTLSSYSGPQVNFTVKGIPGNVTVYVNATLEGVSQPSSATIMIISLDSVSISPSSAILSAGSTKTFSATPVCSGTCPPGVTYLWDLTNSSVGSLNTMTGSSVIFTAGSIGGNTKLTVNASLKGITVESVPVLINVSAPLPSIELVSISPLSATVDTGKSFSPFVAIPTCSPTCPQSIQYTWRLSGTLGSLNSSNGSSVTFTAGSKAGTADLTVYATLNGKTVDSPASVITIKAASPPAPTLFGLPLEIAYSIIGVIVFVIAASILVFSFRRKRGGGEEEESGEEEEEESEPSADENPYSEEDEGESEEETEEEEESDEGDEESEADSDEDSEGEEAGE